MHSLFSVSAAVLVLAGVGSVGRAERAVEASPQAAAGVIQSQDTNVTGVVAEFIECKRKDGVLSLRIRLRNTSGAAVNVPLISNRNFDEYYVTAGSKKYFILRDDEKTPLAPAASPFGGLSVDIPKGGSWTWWAKYPAPPDSETKINYFTPLAPPFEDVTIGS
jgi:hypothetical protein